MPPDSQSLGPLPSPKSYQPRHAGLPGIAATGGAARAAGTWGGSPDAENARDTAWRSLMDDLGIGAEPCAAWAAGPGDAALAGRDGTGLAGLDGPDGVPVPGSQAAQGLAGSAGPAGSGLPAGMRFLTAPARRAGPDSADAAVWPAAPGIPATTQPGARMVPLCSLVPVPALSELLYPPSPDAGDGLLHAGELSGGQVAEGGAAEGGVLDANPVLDLVRELVAAAAPELAYGHWRAGSGPEEQMPRTLRDVLSLPALTSLMDVLLGPGLVLSPQGTRAGREARIVLRARRDPDGMGMALLETVSSPEHQGHTFELDTGTVPGSWEREVTARRDTLPIAGPAGRYELDVEITAAVTPARQVRRAGQELSGVPAAATARRQPGPLPGAVRLREQVLIPHALMRPGAPPAAPPAGMAAVTELDRGDLSRPGRLNITGDDILSGDVLLLGFDREKLQVLFDAALARLAASDLPVSGRELESMLRAGCARPALARAGVLFTGGGGVSVRADLFDPQSAGYFSGLADDPCEPGGPLAGPGQRAEPWLRVEADAVIRVTVSAGGGRWLARGPREGGVAFLVRRAVTLALSPQASVAHGVYHRGGIPVPAGIWYPAAAGTCPARVSTRDLMDATFAIPALTGALAVQVGLDSHGMFQAGHLAWTAGELAASISERLSELPPPQGMAGASAPGPWRLEWPDHPIVLLAPEATLTRPGNTASPAQALADALRRPVLTVDSAYRIAGDGSVLAVRLPLPAGEPAGGRERDVAQGTQPRTAQGREASQCWPAGSFVAVFPRLVGPRAKPPPPKLLPGKLADAIAVARSELCWHAAIGVRAAPAWTHGTDVHFGARTPEQALAEWTSGSVAVEQLHGQAARLLPCTGDQRASLASQLAAAHASVLAAQQPAAPAVGPAQAWQLLTGFRAAVAHHGEVVAGIVAEAVICWHDELSLARELPARLRALLPAEGSGQALAQLEQAIAALPAPPDRVPVTLAGITAAARSAAGLDSALRTVDEAEIAVIAAAVSGWPERASQARRAAHTALTMLGDPPPAGRPASHAAAITRALQDLGGRPAPPRDPARAAAAMAALSRLVKLEERAGRVLGTPGPLSAAPEQLTDAGGTVEPSHGRASPPLAPGNITELADNLPARRGPASKSQSSRHRRGREPEHTPAPRPTSAPDRPT
jgi:hypothetical protein